MILAECYASKCVQKYNYHRLLVYNPKDYYYPFKVRLSDNTVRSYRLTVTINSKANSMVGGCKNPTAARAEEFTQLATDNHALLTIWIFRLSPSSFRRRATA